MANPTQPQDLALQIVELRSDQRILQREVSTSIQNLSSSTQALQADVRHLVDQMGEFGRLQQQQLNHSEGLERAFKSIERVAAAFEAYKERQEQAFEAYKLASDREHRIVADKATEFGGRLRGVWMAGGIVVLLGTTLVSVAWNQLLERLNDQKAALAEAKAERVALEARRQSTHDADAARLQRQIDDLRGQIDQIQGVGAAR